MSRTRQSTFFFILSCLLMCNIYKVCTFTIKIFASGSRKLFDHYQPCKNAYQSRFGTLFLPVNVRNVNVTRGINYRIGQYWFKRNDQPRVVEKNFSVVNPENTDITVERIRTKKVAFTNLPLNNNWTCHIAIAGHWLLVFWESFKKFWTLG